MKNKNYLLIFGILLTSTFCIGQTIIINGDSCILQNGQTKIIRFDIGDELVVNYSPSIDNIKYKFRILPLSHEKNFGYLIADCSSRKKKTNRTLSVRVKNRIPQQQQGDPHPSADNNCNGDFTLETKELNCINRIVIKVYDKTGEYLIELRPNQICD